MRVTFIVVIIAALIGCRPDDRASAGRQLDRLSKDVSDQLTSLGLTKEDASRELDKLFTIEYRVIPLPADLPPEQLQDALSTAGRDRWDCYHIERREKEFLAFCRRQPKTPLRLIPRVF